MKAGGKEPYQPPCVPKSHHLLDWERQAIIEYKREHPELGYRRLTFMMLDEEIVAVSPSSVLNVLQQANLSRRWTPGPGSASRKGFEQPTRPHEQWHTDISYLNILGTHYFFISVLDGFSRAIIHHEIRQDMETRDVEIVMERALEKLPKGIQKPRLISDNGPQYTSKDFKEFLRERDVSHSRARPYHPQSNGKIERFHGSMKSECVRREPMIDLESARELIAGYVDEYNTKRLHSALQYLTPWDYLQGDEHIKSRLLQRRNRLDMARQNRKAMRQQHLDKSIESC